MADEKKGPLDQVLDVVFYAPLGFFMNIEEVIPQLVEKGRQSVGMARMFGQFAVERGQSEASKAVSRVQKQAGERAGRVAGQAAATTPGTGGEAESALAAADSSVAYNGAVTTSARASAPAVSSLAIPDYESLSASQVVPRLDGLSPIELEAVETYENAHRGRKTILNKISQLRG